MRANLKTVAWYRARLEERMQPARDAVASAVETGDVVYGDDKKMDSNNIMKATRLALDAYGAHDWDVQPTDEANIDTSQQEERRFCSTHSLYDKVAI